MPHTARKKSESGFFHVVAKGSGGQIIFEQAADCSHFISLLEASSEAFQIDIHGYCLMSNHVHLLVKDLSDDLGVFMKQLLERYAMYFARHSGRVGNVFQTPFWSEPIENDSYYLCVLRYIHANPELAGISTTADYPWSSYQSYTGASSFIETKLAFDLLGGTEEFVQFSSCGGSFALPFPKSKLRRHLSTNELLHVATETIGREAIINIRSMKPSEREPLLTRLASAGLKERDICRITGLGKGTVHRAIGT